MFALVLLGLSLAPDQIPASLFTTVPSYPDTSYAANPPCPDPTGWRGTDRQLEEEEIENHNPLSPQDIYGVSMLSAPPWSPSHTTLASNSSSISVEPYTQSGLQDNYTDLTSSFLRGQVESATENVVATQGQSAITQGASLREWRAQRKKENDRERSKANRSNNKQFYEKMCKLLKISWEPKKTLDDRSECLCIHPRQLLSVRSSRLRWGDGGAAGD